MQQKFNTKYDLIIDDGLHSTAAQLNTLLFGLDNINDGGYIIIEDINKKIVDNWFVFDYILKNSGKFKTSIVNTNISCVFVVQKLPQNN